MLKIGTILGNRYEILEKIGAGGMSVVYKARDTKLERPVTVKVLRDELTTDENFISRFKVEAQAAASLSHPNIVNVYDVGTEYDTYYIVMEFIDGFTLKEIIEQEAPFNNKRALNYALKIAAALQHAHKNHIIHRDIKPQNILVTKEGKLKVTDFGIAHAATSSTLTMTTTAIGSVHYFSPEQARGGYVDEKSDLYSLGIVMYEMVTGKLPFEGDSSVSIALKHINEELPSISKINPNISKSLEKIILKSTQKRVDQRYQDIDNMILDMKRALNDPSGNFIETRDLTLSSTQKLSDGDLKVIRSLKSKTEDDYEVEEEAVKQTDDEKIEDSSKLKEDEQGDNIDDEGYEHDSLNKSEEVKLVISAIATACAIIALIIALTFLFIKKPSDSLSLNEELKEVPNLVNMTKEEAGQLLIDNGIVIKIADEKVESDEIEEGLIAVQNPISGTQVAKGSEVTVFLSKGVQRFEVPKLVGLTQREAADIIESGKHFNLDEPKKVYSEDVAPGLIVSQVPKDGEMAKFATTIEINISRGPEPKTTVVPDLLGLYETKARSKIENANLIPDVSYQADNSVVKGKVISQQTPAGKELHEGEAVSFIVSTGKPEIEETTTKPSEELTTKSAEATKSSTESIEEATKSKDLITKSITVPKPLTETQEEILVDIYETTTDKRVFSESKDLSEFPFTVSVQGSGNNIEYQIYFDGKLQDTPRLNFDE